MADTSLLVRYGKKLRPVINRVVERYSIDPTGPILASDDFEWTRALRAVWRDIRAEAMEVLRNPVPSLVDISPDHEDLVDPQQWKSFFLFGYGHSVADNLARCPRTAAALAGIPALNTAFFSILQPGTHILDHEGVTKGLITCHLGLIVPETDGCRMRVDRRYLGWAPGETLVFDDTFNHEVWNNTEEVRVVLLIQARRRIRMPGRIFSEAFLWGIRHSSFVSRSIRNLKRWNVSHSLKAPPPTAG